MTTLYPKSYLGKIYQKVYEYLCGKNSYFLPRHFQWQSTLYLRRTLKMLLPKLRGKVLDVGCGKKPYQILKLNWLNDTLNLNKLNRLIKGMLLPFWLPFSLVMNLLGLFLDRLDLTNKFYNNVLVVCTKPNSISSTRRGT